MQRLAPLAVLIGLIASAALPAPLEAAQNIAGSPKIINLYLNWQLRTEDLPKLAKWDAVVLDADQQARYPDRVRELRRLNPKIKIFAYLPSEEIAQARFSEPSDYPFAKLASQIQDDWYLRDPSGQHAYFWPGSTLLNVTDLGPAGPTGIRWNQYFPRFIHDEILSSGLWDGVFLDNTFDGISGFAKSALDLNRDGRADSAADDNVAWQKGMREMLTRIHQLDPNAIVIGNGGSAYADLLNGAFFEHFPSYSWGPNWKEYLTAVDKSRDPNFTGLNVNTDNQVQPNAYQKMRFGLASTLVGGGWYSFDQGDWGHDVLWWYDEYDAPVGDPQDTGAASSANSSVWERDYSRGLAIVNGGAKSVHMELPGVFEKIRGSQDPKVNDGSLVTAVDLAAQDGLVLLRQANAADVTEGAFTNGAFIRAFDGNGTQIQNGFFAHRAGVPNGATIVTADIDGDGKTDVASAQKGVVSVQYGNGKTATAHPFGYTYTGKIFLAVGNTDHSNALELIVGREGAPPEVRVLTSRGATITRWNAYRADFRGGDRVAIGDLDGDGKREIVTGAGPGGGPHIRIWKTDGSVWGGSFFAFDPTDSGGVSVAVGDVDHDGKDEIIVGSGQGDVPRVRVFDFRGTLKKEFVLGSTPIAGGITVSAADLNHDGVDEILVEGLSAF